MISINQLLYFLRIWLICFFYFLGCETFLSVIDKTRNIQKVISTSSIVFDLVVGLFLALWIRPGIWTGKKQMLNFAG